MKSNFSTRGGNVGSMKRLARQDFVPGLARRCKGGEKPEVTLRPNGIQASEFERECRNYGLGYTKFKGGKYRLAYVG